MTAVPKRLVVLLADDDENDAILIRRTFEAIGSHAKLLTVHHGEAVIAYLQGDGIYANRSSYPVPDVLILDHRMPRLSGLGVLCWLRSDPRFMRLPTLIFSLALMPSEADAIHRLGAAYCAKPITPDDTRSALEKGLKEAFRTAQEPQYQHLVTA